MYPHSRTEEKEHEKTKEVLKKVKEEESSLLEEQLRLSTAVLAARTQLNKQNEEVSRLRESALSLSKRLLEAEAELESV